MSKPLFKLDKGSKFRPADDAQMKMPPLVKELGLTEQQEKEMNNAVYKFIGIDGMYAQVAIENKELHEILCRSYDKDATFFCISAGTEVVPEG